MVMSKYLSEHAKDRIEQRGIAKFAIENAIKYGYVNDGKSTEKANYIEHDTLRVILSHDGVVITAYIDESHSLKEEVKLLGVEADDLAKQFRHYFNLAGTCYANGLGAEAKSYSDIGHSLKKACIELNQYIDGLRIFIRSKKRLKRKN